MTDPTQPQLRAMDVNNHDFAQDDDIPGIVRYRTYEVLKDEVANPRLRWAYLPYSMHMAGPREAIQHMIIRKNFGEPCTMSIADSLNRACNCPWKPRVPHSVSHCIEAGNSPPTDILLSAP